MDEYVMDPSFRDELKRIDPKIGYFFNGKHVVLTYKRPVGPPAIILVIRDEVTGGFRHPDKRDLATLMAGDMHNTTVRARLEKIANYMSTVRVADKIRTRELIRDITKDDKLQLSQAFNRVAGSGKGNSAFRRITPKRSRYLVEIPPTPGIIRSER